MRVIQFYKTESGSCPVEEFLNNLPEKQSKNIAWTLRMVRELEPVPVQYFKKLKSTDDLWEIRAPIGNNTFRLLGFFDGAELIILTSGFAKRQIKFQNRKSAQLSCENGITLKGKKNEKGRFRNLYCSKESRKRRIC